MQDITKQLTKLSSPRFFNRGTQSRIFRQCRI